MQTINQKRDLGIIFLLLEYIGRNAKRQARGGWLGREDWFFFSFFQSLDLACLGWCALLLVSLLEGGPSVCLSVCHTAM